jgi:cation diffusion facilitator family transporter
MVTLVCNLLAAVVKLGVGLWSGALSLVADGLDTLFDGLSNVVGLLAVRISSQPPDAEHPYGHRKFETLAALLIAVALFVTAWELTTGALGRLFDPPPLTVEGWSIGALLLGGLLQAVTGWWEWRKGRQLGSEVLLADARHTLASIGVSGAVLVGLGLVWFGYTWADPLVALLVAGVIAKIGLDTLAENIPALVDRAPLTVEQIAQVVEGVAGIESYHRIRSRGQADQVAIDLQVRVSPKLSIQEANAIADEVRRRLLALPGVDDVTVHAEAQRGPDNAPDLYSATRLAAQELGVSIHEWWVQLIDQELRMHLHVGVDPNLTLAEAHQMVDRLEQLIEERLPEVRAVYTHLELANPEILPGARVSVGLQQRITAVVQKAAEGIPHLSHPHEIQVHQVEGKLFITVEALVDGNLSMSEAHELSTRLQEAIRAGVSNVGEALVHLEPHIQPR